MRAEADTLCASVSIIVLTRNRLEHLLSTLTSILASEVPHGISCQLLIVDNDPGASARGLVDSLDSPSFHLSYLHEPRPGKSHACNSALRHATGSILLFTDDDVRVPARWLEGMIAPILQSKADAVLGGIELAEELQRPWMTARHRSVLAATERLNPRDPRALIGANMAVSRRVFERIQAFDVELGPGALGFGEDSLLAEQAMVAGFRIAAAFDVVVKHHFGADRLTRRALLNYARKKGQSTAYIDYHWRHEALSFPVLREVVALSRLVLWRLSHIAALRSDEGLSEAEMLLVRSYHRFRHFRKLTGTRRHYERFGLEKLNGIGVS